ncbi:MAG: glycosyltransferase family 2 protein [Paludibacteraceae bacterium]|nr:glycosyltransferase family 2 protein [Paludibacteraceae bacterium]
MLTAIICTYNRAKYIGNLLESIAANDLPKNEYEILLVDNNCTDNTREICEAFAAAHTDVQFRYTTEPEQGLSAAKNHGIKEAQGDIIVYIDDDALVDPWYLRTYAEWFTAHPETIACGGPILPLYETAEPEWMTPYTKALLTAWMDYGDKPREYPKGRFPGGGNAAYRKSVFDKVGYFNTALGRKGNSLMGAEEKDIFDKMHSFGMQIMYIPSPVLHHIIPQKKLEKDYFDRWTLQIGMSERKRTLAISKTKYVKRLFSEAIKWGGTIVLLCLYTISFHPAKGWKLIQFRYNVSKGLLGLISAV